MGYITTEVKALLIGTFQHSLDAKGRLFIPAKLRDELGERFVITRGTGGCLFGFSFDQWEAFSEKLRALPLGDANAQRVVRLLSAWATDVELDKQGRVLLSANLRECAGLEKDATIIGATNRIEIWSRTTWESYYAKEDIGYDEAMSLVGI
ncbi:MAG: division/cell wall cluster transcriptional repressor MraZ [Bacillota bacterium]